MLANSKEGKRLIDEGFKITRDNFFKHIDKVRNIIQEYSNEELFETEVLEIKKKIIEKLENQKSRGELRAFKYYCHCVGEYEGSDIWLYDNDGEGIRDSEHLKNVLTKWGEQTEVYKDLKIYVIPVDVHS